MFKSMFRSIKDDLFFLCSRYYIIWHDFWVNSCHRKTISKIQKRIITVIMGYSNRFLCEVFKNLEVLPMALESTCPHHIQHLKHSFSARDATSSTYLQNLSPPIPDIL